MKGGVLNFFGSEANRQLQFEPYFPVEGNRIFDDFLRQEGGIEFGPDRNADASAVAVQGPQLFGQVGCERREYLAKGIGSFGSDLARFVAVVGKDHHLRDGGVEFHVLHVVAHLFDGLVKNFQGLLAFGAVCQVSFFTEEGGDASQEVVHSLHPVFCPGFGGLQRTDEHLVQTQGVGAEFLNHIVGVDHIFQ